MEAESAEENLAKFVPQYRIEIERHFPFPVEQVWKAISEAKEITAWMQYPTELDLRVGGRIYIDFRDEGSLEGVVCKVDPEKTLTYTWDDSLVKWELEAGKDDTRLRFTHSGVNHEHVIGLGAGWHCFIDQLESHLDGVPREDRMDELQELFKRQMENDLLSK